METELHNCFRYTKTEQANCYSGYKAKPLKTFCDFTSTLRIMTTNKLQWCSVSAHSEVTFPLDREKTITLSSPHSRSNKIN